MEIQWEKEMRLFFKYLVELLKEAIPLTLFSVGVITFLSSYFIPSLKGLPWIGWFCMAIGFVLANFRLYKRYTPELFPKILNQILDELTYNSDLLQHIKWSTTPALRDDAFQSASNQLSSLPDDVRTQLTEVYRKIGSVKAIHTSIQSLEHSNTGTEQMDIEGILESLQASIPTVSHRLSGELHK
ncbi:MAG: hypothetical protein IH977_17225 [Nitrospinae bacterium]|nr:hypothetical protein [Nitrospinota bacterium]